MNGWTLVFEGFDPEKEPLREALCTLGNGYFATRGAAPEASADDTQYPGTYVAGLYDRLTTTIAGREVENEDLVNAPNWLPLTFRRPGESWLSPSDADLLDYRQELDARAGIVSRVLRVRHAAGGTSTVTQRRLVSMADPHFAALETTFLADGWSGPLEIRSCIDGSVTNQGVARYRALRGDHLQLNGSGFLDGDAVWLSAITTGSRRRLAMAATTRVVAGSEPGERSRVKEGGVIGHEIRLHLNAGEPLTVEKVACLWTDRDAAIYEPATEARSWIARADSFESMAGQHAEAWDHLWKRFDTRIQGPERAQLILRLHVFHLLQTVSPHTIGLDVGVPARGLHGEAYRGHIFWDELFILPFINLRFPVLSKSLLEYRYRRLPEARHAAREAGYRGAMFPWQSGSSGREESQRLHLNPKSGRWLPDNSRLQRHIGSAIAHNAWRYFSATGDLEFLRFRGAPLIIEVARFWCSIATHDPGRQRYEIRGVMGPDEYHDAYPGADEPGLNNNAYTNVMAASVLATAIEALGLLRGADRTELVEALDLDDGEIEAFETIGRRLVVPFHDGVISQFEGYDALEELDWDGYRKRYGDIHRLDRILEAEGDSPNRYKVSKQADVLMLFYLLSAAELRSLFERLEYEFDPVTDIPRNVQYYLKRTSHGSTLSRLVHAWVMSRHDRPEAWAHFNAALESDIADVQGGTTPEGIHLGAMAGTVDMVQRCYAGIEARDDTLVIDPGLPDAMGEVELTVHYRGQRIRVEVRADEVVLASYPRLAGPARLLVGERELTIMPGESHRVPLST